jgi:predicted Rossmann fold flavoprotein
MSDPVIRDVIIIGAGASGLFCAIECGRRGRSVLVLDHADRICSKVLVSGGGRCNFTNLNVTPEHYLSSNPHFCRSALTRFTPQDLLSLVREHGIAYYEKEQGQLFCVKTSREIVLLLKQECDNAGVVVRLGCRIDRVEKEGRFRLVTGQGVFHADSLVVATGGLSYRNLGASEFGHDLARQFGLTVTPVRPALVPFTWTGADRKTFQDLAGVSFECEVSCGNKAFRGRLLFTHRGLSGPAALQASLYWKQGEILSVDLLPGTDVAAVLEAERRSKQELKTLLSRFFPRRFADLWCGLFAPSRPINQCSGKDLRAVAEMLHAWQVVPAGTEGYGTAEVTAGGVDTDEVSSKTMEAKKVSGLYFIGELLDVTGELGGYNLHWAWASGRAAGQYA